VNNTSGCKLNNGNILREVTLKIGLERINTQERVIVEALLDSKATECDFRNAVVCMSQF